MVTKKIWVFAKNYANSKEILGHLHAWRAKFIWCQTSYAGGNVDEKLDSLNAPLLL
jgi:hypothetical protein